MNKKQLIAITFTVLVGEEVTDEELKENKSLLRDLTKKIFKTKKVQVNATYETQE